MKKEQLIKKIGDAVMKNSKKGILTLTKFVGTYNYKSGYDSYFAVSIDMDNTLVVYSYYQNDRGEHIDTCTYKLADLPENELKEVYKNLNTDDKYSTKYAVWTNTEEKNLEILIANGIYKQTKKKEAFIDIDSIPELENEKDAYWIDRDENVGIMKYRGRTPLGEPVYEVGGHGFIDQPYFLDGKPRVFHETKHYRKNKGAFFIVDYDDSDNHAFIFVPTKEQLLDIAKKERNIKVYYFVDDILASWRQTRDSAPEKSENVHTFEDKNEAIAFINEKKEAFLKKYGTLLEKLNNCKTEISEALGGISFEEINNSSIEAKDYQPGVKYHESWGSKFSKMPFTITSVEEKTGLLLTDNGFVLKPGCHLMTTENVNASKTLEKYKKVAEYVKDIDKCIHLLNRAIKSLNEYVPFTGECQFPGWIENDSKTLLNNKSNVMKKITSEVMAS